MGDGEQQEGEVWEAAMSATKFKLDNLTAIIDRNGIQQDGLTEQIMPLEPLASKWRAFNWNVIEVDGYDYLQLIDAFDNAEMTKHRPTMIIAHTVKGKGVSFMEWSPTYHGTAPSKDKMTDIYNELKVSMRPVEIAPSILAYDLGNLGAGLEIASRGGADLIHLDVIDGHFAPNITFGPGTVKALRPRSEMKFDTHLMISRPAALRRQVHRGGFRPPDIPGRGARRPPPSTSLYSVVRSKGKEMGLALKPETQLPRVGRGAARQAERPAPPHGQSRVQRPDDGQAASSRRSSSSAGSSAERGLELDIEIDGGIDEGNVDEVAKRGGNVFVAGAGVYGRPDPVKAIGELRARAEAARGGS